MSEPDERALSLDALRLRARVFRAIRAHLDAADFIEVDTPLAVPCPGMDVHLAALEVVGLGAPRWLATSPEFQMKRLLVAGLPRIYQLSKCFRKGELGRHHEPEFTMLEFYRANAGSDAVMRDTESLVESVAREICSGTTLPSGSDVAPPWPRVTIEAAFRDFAGVAVYDVLPDEERFYRILIDAVEPALAALPHPVFLTRWPACMASLARLCPDDPRWADRFEAYVDGLEQKLSSVGDDAQLANIDLQNKLQQQQQTLQTMSNVSKMLHDTAMAIIRKIG